MKICVTFEIYCRHISSLPKDALEMSAASTMGFLTQFMLSSEFLQLTLKKQWRQFSDDIKDTVMFSGQGIDSLVCYY